MTLRIDRYVETPVLFNQGDASLIGICSLPVQPKSTGVLILVGGPQYRAGSHRQFVLLARALAEAGTPVMRFDFSGTGDSSGEDRGFEGRSDEIRSAIDAFMAQESGLKQVVLWGLCDGASTALFYAPTDPRVVGLTLLNPWVRSQAGLAKTHLKHYYGARLRDPAFWRKLLSGSLNIGTALGNWFSALKLSRGHDPNSGQTHSLPFQQRMAEGWRAFIQQGSIYLIISGNDLTAKEFIEYAASDASWKGLLEYPSVIRRDLVDADHTFSSAAWRDQVTRWTIKWLDSFKENSR